MSNSPADNWPKVEDSFKLWYKALDFDKYSLLFLKKCTRASDKFKMAKFVQHGRHAIISAME